MCLITEEILILKISLAMRVLDHITQTRIYVDSSTIPLHKPCKVFATKDSGPLRRKFYCLPIHDRPAVRMNSLSTNRATIITSQEYKDGCNLARLTWPAHR